MTNARAVRVPSRRTLRANWSAGSQDTARCISDIIAIGPAASRPEFSAGTRKKEFAWVRQMAFLVGNRHSHRLAKLMALKPPPFPVAVSSVAGAEPEKAAARFVRACAEAVALSRAQLLAIALARGCRHYAGLWPELKPADTADFPHEILGVALLAGPADVATFQAIRCGAMVLSDLGNNPARITEASSQLGLTARVAHVARLGRAADEHAEFWDRILSALPPTANEESDFLPGISRLVSETRIAGPGFGRLRVWLRTNYQP